MRNTKVALYLWHFTLSEKYCPRANRDVLHKELQVLAKKFAYQLEDSSLEPEIPDNEDFSDTDSNAESDDDAYYSSSMDEEEFDSDFTDYESNSSDFDSGFDSDDSDCSFLSNSSDDESDDEEQEGYIHWQGTLSLVKKRNLSSLVKLVKANGFVLKHAHFSPASNNSGGSMMYAMKIDTRISDETYTDQTEDEIPMPRQLKHIKELRSWQQEIMDRSQYNWNARHINWLYDPTGNSGKSSLVLWCKIKKFMDCKLIPVMLSSSNQFVELNASTLDQPCGRLYFIDLPKALNKKSSMAEFYSYLETLKTGYVYDKRYKFRERVFSSPAIWVMSNVLPDKSMLSKDRLVVWSIRDDNELVLYPSMEKSQEKIKYPLTDEQKELLRFYFDLWRGQGGTLDECYSIDETINDLNEIELEQIGEFIQLDDNLVINNDNLSED